MFVNLVEFPPIKKGKDQDFKDWFKESTQVYKKFDGFISRRLLVSEEGRYAAIVEHRNKDTFMKMHTSKERNDLFAKVAQLYEGRPKPNFYEVVEL